MNVGFKNTAPMDKTGGLSQLDRKPPAFLDLEHRRRLLAETGKMTAMVSKIKMATPEHQPPSPHSTNNKQRPATTSSARELLLKTNNLLSMLDSKSSSRIGTARVSSSGNGSSSSRLMLESIKYEARKGNE